jgi:hypothetical protein
MYVVLEEERARREQKKKNLLLPAMDRVHARRQEKVNHRGWRRMPTNLAEEDYYDYFGRPKGGWCRENTMKMARMVMERRSESTFWRVAMEMKEEKLKGGKRGGSREI